MNLTLLIFGELFQNALYGVLQQIPEGFELIIKIVSNSLNEVWHSLNGTAAMLFSVISHGSMGLILHC